MERTMGGGLRRVRVAKARVDVARVAARGLSAGRFDDEDTVIADAKRPRSQAVKRRFDVALVEIGGWFYEQRTDGGEVRAQGIASRGNGLAGRTDAQRGVGRNREPRACQYQHRQQGGPGVRSVPGSRHRPACRRAIAIKSVPSVGSENQWMSVDTDSP